MLEPTSRRTLLRGLALGGLVGTAGLAGCELPRLERDGRDAGQDAGSGDDPRSGAAATDVADGPELESVLGRTHELMALARGARTGQGTGAVVRTARETLAAQADVLQRLLEAAGVPVPPGEPQDTGQDRRPSPGADPAGRGATQEPDDDSRPRVRQLARALGAEVQQKRVEELASVSSANLAMLTSLTAQRGALATLLGSVPGWEPLTGPTGQPAAAMLDVFGPAVYAFEVVAARAAGDERSSYEQTLGQLRRVARVLTELAGPAAPPAPLGYGLPEGLGGAQGRRALAREVLAALPPAVMRDAGSHTGDLPAVAGTVQVLAISLALGHDWGAPVAAFPGMTTP